MNAARKIEPGSAMPKFDGMLPNKGRAPADATGKRVVVQLANGRVCGSEPVSAGGPTGWAVETTRWTITGSGWDIAFYKVLQ